MTSLPTQSACDHEGRVLTRLTFIPPRALDINFNGNFVHTLCQRGPDKPSNKFEKNRSMECRKMCMFPYGTFVGLERQIYTELLNKIYRRVSLKMIAVMITIGQQRVKEGK